MKPKNTANPTNSTIKCGVDSCSHHNSQDYCSLNQIQVGATGKHVTSPQNTECASFQLDKEKESIYGQGSN